MSLQGHVSTISLFEILQLLASNRSSGRLTLSREGEERSLVMAEGMITSAQGFEADGRQLGSLLVQRGLLTQLELNRLLRESDRTSRRLGTVLLHLGRVTEEEISETLRMQLLERICDLFAWEDAAWEFAPGEAEHESQSLPLNTDAVLMEAARRHDEWNRFWDHVGGPSAILCVRPGREQALGQALQEVRVPIDAALLLRGAPVRRLLAEQSHNELAVASLLLGLLEQEALEVLPLEQALENLHAAREQGQLRQALDLLLHADQVGLDIERIRALLQDLLEQPELATHARGHRLALPCQGVPLVELLVELLRSRLPALVHITAGRYAYWLRVDAGLVALDAEGRELFTGLSRMSPLHRHISRDRLPALLDECHRTGEVLETALTSRGVPPEELEGAQRSIVLQVLRDLVILENAKLDLVLGEMPGVDPLGPTAVRLHLVTDGAWGSLLDPLESWLERARLLPCVDLVVTATGAASSSEGVTRLLRDVGELAIVRQVLEETRLPARVAYGLLTEAMADGALEMVDEDGLVTCVLQLLEEQRPADALRLCRGGRVAGYPAGTFQEVEEAILAEHGELAETATRHELGGDLQDLSLGQLLQSLGESRKSGTLVLTGSPAGRWTIYLERGDPHLLLRPGEEDRYGPRLRLALEEGVLDVEEIPEDLRELVLRYLDATQWERASFSFTSNYFPEEFLNPGPGLRKQRHSLERFLLQLVSFTWDEEALEERQLHGTVFAFTDPFAKARASRKVGDYADVLRLFDGTRTLGDVLQESGVDPAILTKLVRRLQEHGFLRQVSAG